MRRAAGWRARAILALALSALGAAARAAEAPPEPPGFRLDDYRSATPDTVLGREALDTAAARRLWESSAIFVDVLPAPRRPESLPPTALWAPRPHLAIPGSVWLPDVGRGELSAAAEDWFRRSLERITGGDRGAALVFYCLVDCWMSWNATRRALGWGYEGARWYRDGIDGWQLEGLPVEELRPPEDAQR